MIISLIAAIGPNRELGKDNKLIWHIREDLKRFKKITKGHTVIMGRKTFESIGKPLPGRLNIIVTRNQSFKIDHYNVSKYCNAVVCHSLEEALKYVQHSTFNVKRLTFNNKEVFIIGGGEIYRQAIGIADKLYLTIVDKEAEADTFFPDYSEFKKVVFEEKNKGKGYSFRFIELER